MAQQQAIVAGGCFWCTEAVMKDVIGVSAVESGYIGGHQPNPTYKEVCTGNTGHAEGVRVTFDDAQITLGQLYDVFLGTHDPTQLNRQGPDRGAHYRGAIVPMSAEQNTVAKAYIAQLTAAKLWNRPIITQIERAQAFYPAESYHQDFMLKNPRHSYIVRWDAPKVKALKAMYPGVYSASFRRD